MEQISILPDGAEQENVKVQHKPLFMAIYH
jgi:hypothetical protein